MLAEIQSKHAVNTDNKKKNYRSCADGFRTHVPYTRPAIKTQGNF